MKDKTTRTEMHPTACMVDPPKILCTIEEDTSNGRDSLPFDVGS